MDTASVQIRRLTAADVALYRDIRLDALRSNREAYGSTLQAESARPLNWFTDRLGSSEVFGAFQGPELVGIAALSIAEGQKEAHKGMLRSVYVRSGARKTGVGRRLIVTILELARPRIEIIQLTVVSDNQEALRLYSSLGFVEYGIEKRALKQDGRYYDKVLMAKDLKSEITPAPTSGATAA